MLRTTVIAKTDICAYTPKVSALSEAELSALLRDHKQFMTVIATNNEGTIIKGEGDSFWMSFPSATAAALTAVKMQQELRMSQIGKSDAERLAIRVAITLGDVLHQDNDIFGESVNLAARIEAVTPPDEIYLSESAWLALNKTDVHTSFVDEFMLKGIPVPAKVYKIEHTHRLRTITDQTIVLTDLSGFLNYYHSHPVVETEHLLITLDTLTSRACEAHGGTIRQILADGYGLTFAETPYALAAMQELCQQWNLFIRHNNVPCGMKIGMHQGDLNIFRSSAFSEGYNIAASLESLKFSGRKNISIVVSKQIYERVKGTPWEQQLQRVEPERISIPGEAPDPVKKVLYDGIYQVKLDLNVLSSTEGGHV